MADSKAAKLVHLFFLLSLHGCSVVDLSSGVFSQTSVQLPPCTDYTTTVSLNSSVVFSVPRNLSNCVNPTNDSNIGFRVSTRIIADVESDDSKPVVFTARQLDNDGFLSWNAPLTHNSKLFPNVSHTMCPVKNFSSSDALPLFFIDTFTSSQTPVNFSIEVEPVDNFNLEINQTYSVDVGPASPQIYYFKIPQDVQLVTIETHSLVVGCTVVSVQNNTCPVNDLLDNARNKGIYQTMATSAFITINADSVVTRDFLLVLVATDHSICYSNTSNNSDNQQRTITVTIKQMKPISDYTWALMLPVVLCAVIYFFSILVCCCYAPRCEPYWFKFSCSRSFCRPQANTSCRCVCCFSGNYGDEPGDETVLEYSRGILMCVSCRAGQQGADPPGLNETSPLLGSTNQPSVNPSWSGASIGGGAGQQVVSSQSADGTVMGQQSADGTVMRQQSADGTVMRQQSADGTAMGQQSADGTVMGQLLEDQKPFHVYSWNTITVGIFYALPALQLVFSEQKILDQSGDQDDCYYNFKCAHPVGLFSAFNNMWSNIGYILLGILFVIIVFFRHWQYIVRKNKNKEYIENHGVPQFFGIYYAMGFALILEGFMSSFYHICPSNANFQFDTAFMFITGGIILVKVYQNRHPHVQANAFIAFFTFAVIILFTLIGIYNDGSHPLPVKVSFLFLALVVIFLFLAHFYQWKFSLSDEEKSSIYGKCVCGFQLSCFRGCCSAFFALTGAVLRWLFSPDRWKEFWEKEKYRIKKHVLIFGLNVLLGIFMCIFYNDVGIATGVLVFFVLNIILYLVIYCVIKIYYGEPWTWLALLLPVIIGVSWLFAFHFYGTVTEWTDTPAVSRSLNMECCVEGFYDYHDVWHFFSALGMFFAFLFVLVIDDGVVDIKREKLIERAV